MGLRGPKPKADIIWSPEIAYATGLIASDGCLYKDGRHIDLTSKDIEQLGNFMRCIGREIPVTLKQSTYANGPTPRVQFSDVTLYNFFVRIGITPNKSHTIGILDIPDEYFFDFLRGSFDGDGTFYSYIDTRWKNSFMFYIEFISASSAHVGWIREVLKEQLGVFGHITVSKGSKVIQLKYAKRETLLILERLYPNSRVICLSRKRLKIQEALRIVGKSLPEKTLNTDI
jgi:hypothetical protein